MYLGVLLAATVLGSSAASLTGSLREVASDVIHANGNVYDQLLLTGANGSFSVDPGQITRVSFIDLNDDIVQVEFSGAGTLTLTLAGASGPAEPVKYNQPGVGYMRGHASIEISGSDSTTNISIFSVGRKNAVMPPLFRDDVTYDGVADVALLTIKADPANPNGSIFGGIRAGNARFWATEGRTGIYAPRVQVQDVVRIGDLNAHEEAWPVLLFGPNSQFGSVDVFGGSMVQLNNHPIEVEYQAAFALLGGETSAGIVLPAPQEKTRVRTMRDLREIELRGAGDPVWSEPPPFIPIPRPG